MHNAMNGTTSFIHNFNDAFGEKTAESANIYVLLFILWPLAIFTVLGNALAIWAFVTDSRIQSNVTNRYIFCLSISDLIVGCVSLPLNNVWLHFGRWPMGEIVCKTWLVIDYAACYLSVMVILLLSYDRFLWVSWPLKYRQSQTAKTATVKILVTTAFVFTFFTIPILFWDIWAGEKHIDYRMDCEPENSGNFIYGLVFVIFETILPAIGIGVLNTLVYLRIRKTCSLRERSFRNIQNTKETGKKCEIDAKETKYENHELQPKTCGSPHLHGKQYIHSNEHLETDVKECVSLRPHYESVQPPKSYVNGYRKAGRRLATMVGVFLFCWIPFNVCLLHNAVCNDCINNATWETVNYLLWGNSALNPVLYVLTNEGYKRRMISIITWKKPMLHSRESVDLDLQ
ncbi:histamine H3 receptor-like [Amphiura filiformis]|uniref:histamine H3 receptor-like n=1 Tax=Amphiura filiformis TaxID=82378 RepID=UPI003B20D8EF